MWRKLGKGIENFAENPQPTSMNPRATMETACSSSPISLTVGKLAFELVAFGEHGLVSSALCGGYVWLVMDGRNILNPRYENGHILNILRSKGKVTMAWQNPLYKKRTWGSMKKSLVNNNIYIWRHERVLSNRDRKGRLKNLVLDHVCMWAGFHCYRGRPVRKEMTRIWQGGKWCTLPFFQTFY